MADVKSVMAEALGMRREISRLLRLSMYNQYDNLSELKADYEDAKRLFLLFVLAHRGNQPSVEKRSRKVPNCAWPLLLLHNGMDYYPVRVRKEAAC